MSVATSCVSWGVLLLVIFFPLCRRTAYNNYNYSSTWRVPITCYDSQLTTIQPDVRYHVSEPFFSCRDRPARILVIMVSGERVLWHTVLPSEQLPPISTEVLTIHRGVVVARACEIYTWYVVLVRFMIVACDVEILERFRATAAEYHCERLPWIYCVSHSDVTATTSLDGPCLAEASRQRTRVVFR